jgi:predicted nuclease with TOPRIM domain
MSHSLSELLLQYAQQFEDQHAPQNMTIALRESAKELDRLRGDLEAADFTVSRLNGKEELQLLMRQNNALVDEITRLKAEVEQFRTIVAEWVSTGAEAQSTILKLLEERTRLKAEVEEKTDG